MNKNWTPGDQKELEALEARVANLRGHKAAAIQQAQSSLMDVLQKADCPAYEDVLASLADHWEELVPLMEEYRKVRK